MSGKSPWVFRVEDAGGFFFSREGKGVIEGKKMRCLLSCPSLFRLFFLSFYLQSLLSQFFAFDFPCNTSLAIPLSLHHLQVPSLFSAVILIV